MDSRKIEADSDLFRYVSGFWFVVLPGDLSRCIGNEIENSEDIHVGRGDSVEN